MRVSNSSFSTARIRLRVPVIVMVIGATAVPIELRSLHQAALSFGIFAADVLANIAGYVPVGIVLGELGPGRALVVAVSMATFAEVSQLGMLHRDPSAIDVAANAIGAVLGIVVSERWKIRSPGFTLSRWKSVVAAALACVLILAVRATSGYAPNHRGATSTGTLEAYWRFDESRGSVALDSSGHGLHGRFSKEPTRIAGVLGHAVKLDGAADYIDFGRSTPLRLVGSMTISAWINPSSFPVDDASIVSNHNGLGYQLDTTVDRGPRTIGFKLANACGSLMARYGATPLDIDTWYHVAGVYDAEARTLDVYLNGKPDNGFLRGSVTGAQRSSREAVYVGRRSNIKGFEFAGSVDDVRIYSRALTKAEVSAELHGTAIDELDEQVAAHSAGSRSPVAGTERPIPCGGQSDYEDALLPGAAAVLGVFVAVACAGLWPSAGWPGCLAVSFVGGWFLLLGTASTLPAFCYWLIPLTSLAGGASVAAGRPGHVHQAPGIPHS